MAKTRKDEAEPWEHEPWEHEPWEHDTTILQAMASQSCTGDLMDDTGIEWTLHGLVHALDGRPVLFVIPTRSLAIDSYGVALRKPDDGSPLFPVLPSFAALLRRLDGRHRY